MLHGLFFVQTHNNNNNSSSSREQSDYIWKQTRGHDKPWNINKEQRYGGGSAFQSNSSLRLWSWSLSAGFLDSSSSAEFPFVTQSRSNPGAAQTQRLAEVLLYLDTFTQKLLLALIFHSRILHFAVFKGLISDVVKINNPTMHCLVFLMCDPEAQNRS